MYVKALALVLVVAFLILLVRMFRPTRFGLVFGIFLVYLPIHQRAPLNVLPMVNALTLCLVALIMSIPKDSRNFGRRAKGLQFITYAFLAVSFVGLMMAVVQGKPAGDV